MSDLEGAELASCPRCGATTTRAIVAEGGYQCPRCAFEVAHLDVTPTGGIRGVLGWVHAPGEVLAERYRVVLVLGRGGFAVTYLVEDLRLTGKRRAVKEIPKLLYDAYETQLLSRLHHPAIPDIIDQFESGAMVYLVLEFGGTRSLESERRAHQGRVALEQLEPWMRQLCEVLTFLHGQQPPVVHRDLKPENILLDDQGRVMLIDMKRTRSTNIAAARWKREPLPGRMACR